MEVIKISKSTKSKELQAKKEDSKIKVAAYVRVSTLHDGQEHSFKSQELYYKEKIEKKPEWELVKIYADEGISGTSVKRRTGFINMINDALKGKIDIIITKSISRFARNTIDLLDYIRKLKDLGIAVIFEEENINTMEKKGELLLTVLASCAQRESENLSAHVKKGNEMKLDKGELILGQEIYGFKYDRKNNCMKIDTKQAETIKYIFSEYLKGTTITDISRNLTAMNVKTYSGCEKWHRATIRYILRNYKYTGNYFFRKN